MSYTIVNIFDTCGPVITEYDIVAHVDCAIIQCLILMVCDYHRASKCVSLGHLVDDSSY